MQTIAALGEVMIELAPAETHQRPESAESLAGKTLKTLSFAGDTYNTAVYLARLGVKVDYLSCLGDDPYSQAILRVMDVEGIGRSAIEQVPDRVPGLYMIETSKSGERSFNYWRGQSPAKEMLSNETRIAHFKQAIYAANYVYLSGISLAILGDAGRASLFELLQEYKVTGGKIIFDNNYRPRLWKSSEQAQMAMQRCLSMADIALLTDDDEAALWGSASPSAIAERVLPMGVQELVVKRGPNAVVAYVGGNELVVDIPQVQNVIDTTAAGDSFNAGYLASRLAGSSLQDSLLLGAKTAGFVIQHRGAIVDFDLFDAFRRGL